MKEIPETHEAILMVFVGIYEGTDHKVRQYWIPVTKEQMEAGQLPPNWKELTRGYDSLEKWAGPGQVYSFAQQKGTTTLSTPGGYMGLWPDAVKRAEWQAEMRAERAKLDCKKREKDESKEEALGELLEPVLRLYRRLPAPARAQMLARIIHLLSRQKQ